MSVFSASLRWLEPRERGEDLSRLTACELELTAGSICLTEVWDTFARTTRSTIRVSAAPLAAWWLWNRWRVLNEGTRHDPSWRLSHELSAAGEGFLWPPLRLLRRGDHLRLTQRPGRGAEDPIRFLRWAEVDVPVADVQAAFDDLTERTLARLTALGHHHTDLHALWRAVQGELLDPAAVRLRQTEAMLGLDPGEVEEGVVQALRTSAGWMGESAAEEVLSAVPFGEAQGVLLLLHEVQSAAPRQGIDLGRLPTTLHVEVGLGLAPWDRGLRHAQALRQALGLGLGPVDLHELLGIPRRSGQQDDRGLPFSIGLAPRRRGARLPVVLHQRHQTGQRFALARIVGDWLMRDGDDRVLPVTDQVTSRQQRQRAFAQELLCPVAGLQQRLSLPEPTESELLEAAEEYGVSEYVVRYGLYNAGLLGREYLPDTPY